MPELRKMTERVMTDANGRKYITSEPAPVQEPFGYFQYSIQLDAWVQNRIDNKGAAFYTAGDIRGLKHRIHELEGELIGYKKIVADQESIMTAQAMRIVDLKTHIENLEGEE
jgi:hypothetical protein